MYYRLKTTQSIAYLNGQKYISNELIHLNKYILHLENEIQNASNGKYECLEITAEIEKKIKRKTQTYTKICEINEDIAIEKG